MRIAVLCGGGDAPGLNAAIQGIVTRASKYGYEVYGVLRGYEGLINGDFKPLKPEDVEDIFRIGGTILKTSRTNPYKRPEDLKKILENMKKSKIDVLIAMGGEDTLGAASKLFKDGVPVVGVPKTIDNDLSGTDYTIGFQTAVSVATESLERLHTTGKSHERVMVCEIMGRHAGWITMYAGLAAGAHVILPPEKPFDINSVCDIIKRRDERGKKYTVIAVSEGARPKDVKDLTTVSPEVDEYGHVILGGIGKVLAEEIKKRTGKTTRSVVLGHLQRGGSPIAFDRILGLRLGIHAVELVKERKFGYATSLKGTKVLTVKLDDLVKEYRTADEDLLELTGTFSG
jgi:6-phosphofructokinase 1